VLGSANNGYVLDGGFTVPPEATGIVISADGVIQYSTQNTTNLTQLGQLQLAKFVNPDGLLKLGDNLYQITDASGDETTDNPGQNGFGNIRQGFLEASNVEPVNELIDLITTQRSFELNSQVVQAGDQVMQIVANLRRL
jgi:flagellar basal-body rod protein FlgG